MKTKLKISVIGAGYVGLVTGACLSKFGYQIFFVDKNIDRIKKINSGKDPINEPGLEELLKEGNKKKLITATNDYDLAIKNTQLTFLTVDTPAKNEKINFDQIISATKSLATSLKKVLSQNKEHFIVIKSTVLPGTTEELIYRTLKRILKKLINHVYICFNPEFLRQGHAVNDFLNPDRIVIGTNSKKLLKIMSQLYSNFKCIFIKTSFKNAELIKYVSNIFLANVISFSNEIARICNSIPGTNINTILNGLHTDKRLNIVNKKKLYKPSIINYLKAGPGYGGSCLPKDLKALKFYAKKIQVKTPLLKAIDSINDSQPLKVINHFEEKIGNVKNTKIGMIGLSFKEDSSDLRDSPAIKLFHLLKKRGAKINVWDPVVKKTSVNFIKNLNFSNDLLKTINRVDCIFIATGFPMLKKIDWKHISKQVNKNIIYDSRNILDGRKVRKFFKYYHFGS